MANNIAHSLGIADIPLKDLGELEHRTFNKLRSVLTIFLIPRNNQSEKKSCPAYWLIKDGSAQISTAMRVLPEIIASDVSLLVTFNDATG